MGRTNFAGRYGPWALVTGASSGIGRAMAIDLARRGVGVLMVARRAELLSEVAREVSAFGGGVRSIALDLAEQRGVERVIAEMADLDVGLLVCSAGFGSCGRFDERELGDELGMVDVNCRSLAHLTHVFARRLVARGRGGIVLMGSLVGFQGVPGSANYAATKAYVQSLGEGLHHELKGRGVDVIISAPGPVHSGFAQRANMTMSKAVMPEVVARQTLDALGRRMTVRPGALSKFLEWSLKTLPRWGRVRMMGVVMSGMSQRATS